MTKKRVVGLDVGTNSLGWAVVEKDLTTDTYALLKQGCLVFQEGVKIEKGIESSKASERTEHKALRVQYARRRLRKIAVLRILIEQGWCPFLSDDELRKWYMKRQYPLKEDFLDWQRTDEDGDKNPYRYRHECLHRELDLSNKQDCYVLGRALYHLAQRRGFRSNRLDVSEEQDEKGKVKKGISDLSQEMKEAGCAYLGDYFYKLYKEDRNRTRIRMRYIGREEHYKKEFDAICDRQRLPMELRERLNKSLYFQRPLKSQRQSVGHCTFERKKVRCGESHPAYERFRMLCFINNIKVQGPHDEVLRSLYREERDKIADLFFRKSKPVFDFEDTAKRIAGKGNYQCIKDKGEKGYKFNFRMSQSVCGCPTIAYLQELFGKDYEQGIAEVYTQSANKSCEDMVNDVWNVWYSFSDKPCLKRWAMERLQMNEEQADKFSKIRLSRSFASISITAIRKILPWLERGWIYSHSVLMAKIPDIVGKRQWECYADRITEELQNLMTSFHPKEQSLQGTLDTQIKDYLKDNFELKAGATDALYHPSMIEPYPDVHPNEAGLYQLDSPRTTAVRNPMAMRSLHQLRKVVNMLLREGVITPETEVHIEYARELNNANKRIALSQWNKKREKEREKYAEEIKKTYKEECGRDIQPTDTDILKYQLWKEQGKICLYTGASINVSDFLGEGIKKYDIEHTIPRSAGGDSTMQNLTLCSTEFNRNVKKTKLPSELPEYEEILERLKEWRTKIADLRKRIDGIRTQGSKTKEEKDRRIQERHVLDFELKYWQGKCERFLMKEVPEGFSLRQSAGIGLIGKYAGLYLRSLFHQTADRTKSNVRVIKGTVTAEYRKMWGIQDMYEKKSRDNHMHHCIDAITIACISPAAHSATAHYYKQLEEYEYGRNKKPSFQKPWPTFTEDIKTLVEKTLVVHNTPDNMSKQTKRKIRGPKGTSWVQQGDTARGSLHHDTYYGAIQRGKDIKYVVRRSLSDLKNEADVEHIVDDVVKDKVKAAIAAKGFKEALAGEIYMNEEKGIIIKKVRCYADKVKNPINLRPHRDVSAKPYKQSFYVQNDRNYSMAIYETSVKGKDKRDFELVRMIDAAKHFNKRRHSDPALPLFSLASEQGYPLRYKLRIGLHVLLYEKTPSEIDFQNPSDLTRRLYVVTGLSYLPIGKGYGTIVLRHHQEGRVSKDVKPKSGAYKNDEEYRGAVFMYHTQFRALVEGQDFMINVLGEIKLIDKSC